MSNIQTFSIDSLASALKGDTAKLDEMVKNVDKKRLEYFDSMMQTNKAVIDMSSGDGLLGRLDSNESNFLLRQTALVISEALVQTYPMFSSRNILTPIRDGEGLESIIYSMYSRAGEAAAIGANENDFPDAGTNIQEGSAKVQPYGIKYGYSILDIKKANRAGVALDSKRAWASREGTLQKLNKVFWNGDPARNIKGIFSDFSILNAPTINGSWASSTDAQKFADVKELIREAEIQTNGSYKTEVLATGITNINYMKDTFIADIGSTMTIYDWVVKQGIKVVEAPELTGFTSTDSGVTINNKNVIVCLNARRDVLEFREPVDWTPLPMFFNGFSYVTFTYADSAGVIPYRKYTTTYGLTT